MAGLFIFLVIELLGRLETEDVQILVLLPPDILNADGVLLDDMTLPQLEEKLKAPVSIFAGRWGKVISQLKRSARSTRPRALVRVS